MNPAHALNGEPPPVDPPSTLEPPTLEPVTVRVCANCSAPVNEKFCGQCGEKNLGLHPTLGQFLRAASSDYFHLDRTLLRTLVALLFRPGELSVGYFAGRRQRYIRPMKVYLFSVGVLFSALWLKGDHTRVVTAAEWKAHPDHSAMMVIAPNRPGADDGAFDRMIRNDPQGFAALVDQAVRKDMAKGMVLLVPFLALVLSLLHRRSRRMFVEHFVFALHGIAFGCLATATSVFNQDLLVAAALNGLVGLYLVAALRKFYADPWWKIVPKAAVVLICCAVAISLLVLAVLMGRFMLQLLLTRYA